MTSTLQPTDLPTLGQTVRETDALVTATQTWILKDQTEGKEPKLRSIDVEDRLFRVALSARKEVPSIILPPQFVKVLQFAASRLSSFTVAVSVKRALDDLELLLISFFREEEDKY